MSRHLDLLCIGETLAALTPVGGTSQSALAFSITPAGAESNVAQVVARLGHQVAWASRVGGDPLGRRLVESIRSSGVDVHLVETLSEATTGLLLKDRSAATTRVHYYRRGSAASTMDPDLLPRWRHAAPTVVHVSGVTPALSDSCRTLVYDVVVGRALVNATVSFDVNYRQALWSGTGAGPLLELARAADLVLVGRDEAADLWGTDTSDDVRALFPEVTTVVVKDAAAEAVAYTATEVRRVPALSVRVLEPVGAGDAFAGGFLAGRIRGLSLSGCLRLGHICAAATLMSPYDQGEIPDGMTIERALAASEQEWASLDLAEAVAS